MVVTTDSRTDRTEVVTTNKTDKTDKPDRTDKTDKTDRTEELAATTDKARPPNRAVPASASPVTVSAKADKPASTPRGSAKAKTERVQVAALIPPAPVDLRPRWVLECMNVISKLIIPSKSGEKVR